MRMTGRLTGTDLTLTRTFRASAEDVWASVTEPERSARWFGPWTGEAGPGRTVDLQMVYEDGQPWIKVHIDACEPPRCLRVSTVDESGSYRIEVRLTESGGSTELEFTHHLETTGGIGEMGPGWEYYLDNLVAAREGTPLPSFGDYYPALKGAYEDLV